MTDRNHFSVLGHAGAPPILRATLSGGLVGTFNLATHYRRRDGQTGQWVEATEWHRITVFDELAKIAQESIVSGTPVGVEGYMRTRQFLDGHGNKRYVHELVAVQLQIGAAAGAVGAGPMTSQPGVASRELHDDAAPRVI